MFPCKEACSRHPKEQTKKDGNYNRHLRYSRQGNIDNLVQIYPGLCSVTRKLKKSAMFDFPVLFERSVSKKTYGTHISKFSTRIKLLLVSDKIKLLLLSNEYM